MVYWRIVDGHSMKILQVVPYFHPAYAFGGPVEVAYSISKELVRRGHSVTVYTTDVKNQNERLNVPRIMDIDGIEVHYMSNFSQALVRMSNIYLTLELISRCKSELNQFDIVHLHEFTTFQNIVVSHYAQKYHVPYVLQAHGSIPINGRKVRKIMFNAIFGNSILRRATKVIALSKVERHEYRLRGLSKDKITIVPNGLNSADYDLLPAKGSFKKKFNIQGETQIVLYLGRIHKSKGIGILIKAFAHMIRNMKCEKVLLVIAGPDDGCLGELKSLAASLGISDSVLFTGFVDAKDKLNAMVDARVFVTPSFYGLPVTFLEACMVGTPIITTTLGDKLEWINSNVGCVTSPKLTELAETIKKIIFDDKMHDQFSRNCRQLAKSSFSLEHMVDDLERLYAVVGRQNSNQNLNRQRYECYNALI